MRNAHLSNDSIITLDVATLSRENNMPIRLGLVLVADLSLSVIVAVLVALDSLVNLVVRNVGVIDGLLAVRVGGGNSHEVIKEAIWRFM